MSLVCILNSFFENSIFVWESFDLSTFNFVSQRDQLNLFLSNRRDTWKKIQKRLKDFWKKNRQRDSKWIFRVGKNLFQLYIWDKKQQLLTYYIHFFPFSNRQKDGNFIDIFWGQILLLSEPDFFCLTNLYLWIFCAEMKNSQNFRRSIMSKKNLCMWLDLVKYFNVILME